MAPAEPAEAVGQAKDRMMSDCTPQDLELIRAAHQLLLQRYREDRHEVGAALRARGGTIYCAVNVDTRLRRMAVCAEAIAIGMAVADGQTEIGTIVAVNREGRVVSPCGACREMIADYGDQARVIVPGNGAPRVSRSSALLPVRYRKDGLPGPL